MQNLQANIKAFTREQAFLNTLTAQQAVELFYLLEADLNAKRVQLHIFNLEDELNTQLV